MSDPKYTPGQKVEAEVNDYLGHKPATVRSYRTVWIYTVEFDQVGLAQGRIVERSENQIRLPQPKPTPEQAWEKAGLIIGKRSSERPDYCCIDREEFDKETRHQCYQILGAASVKVTDEVKQHVRRLIELADNI